MYQPIRTRGVTGGTRIDFVPDLGTRLYFQPCEDLGSACSSGFLKWPLDEGDWNALSLPFCGGAEWTGWAAECGGFAEALMLMAFVVSHPFAGNYETQVLRLRCASLRMTGWGSEFRPVVTFHRWPQQPHRPLEPVRPSAATARTQTLTLR